MTMMAPGWMSIAGRGRFAAPRVLRVVRRESRGQRGPRASCPSRWRSASTGCRGPSNEEIGAPRWAARRTSSTRSPAATPGPTPGAAPTVTQHLAVIRMLGTRRPVNSAARPSVGAEARRYEGILALASNNGRSVNLPDHVRRLYAGLETGKATDSSLRQWPYAPVGASSAFSASPLPVVSACFLRPAQ